MICFWPLRSLLYCLTLAFMNELYRLSNCSLMTRREVVLGLLTVQPHDAAASRHNVLFELLPWFMVIVLFY